MTLQTQQLTLGTRVTGGFEVLGPEERRRHLYIIGQTGTGKSTLLLNLIAQDIAAGEGLALLDPHGDLAEAVLLNAPGGAHGRVGPGPAHVVRPTSATYRRLQLSAAVLANRTAR